MPKTLITKIIQIFQNVFSIDFRALAFFRIFIGSIVFIYIIPKLMNVYAFYSDWGIVPRGDYLNLINHLFLSFHLISGQTWVQVLLFLVQAMIALLLIIGYRTRLMTVLAWVFLVSLQNRNPLVLNYGDQLFRMLLFWAIFLPLGAVWSLDSIWDKTVMQTKKWFSVGTVAILLQVILFYVVNWFLKDSVEWKGVFASTHKLSDLFNFSSGFTATYFSMNIGYLVTPFGYFLLRFPQILKLATIIYIFLELLCPLMLLSPFKTKEFRYVSLLIFLTFIHGMLSLMLYTGLFQLFCLAGLALFVPSEVWDYSGKKLFQGQQKLKIYYDGECEFCSTGVCLIKGSAGAGAMLPIQSNSNLLKLGEDITTIIVEDEQGVRYTKIDAFIKLFANSRFTRWLAAILKIKFIHSFADKIYEFVAERRHKISDFIKFIKPNYFKPNQIFALFTQCIAAACLVLVLFWNYGNIVKKDYFADRQLLTIMYTLRLDQYWGMFADHPTTESTWLVIPGELRDGTKVDVMNKRVGEVDFSRQNETPWRFWSQSWRNYFIDYPSHNNIHTTIFAKFLCNDWNRYTDNQKQLSSFTIYTMQQKTLLNGLGEEQERFHFDYKC